MLASLISPANRGALTILLAIADFFICGAQSQFMNDGFFGANQMRKTFTARIPIHMLPSNDIVEYFEWGVEVGQPVCPFTGMLVRARRGVGVSPHGMEENLEDLGNYPSPHCSVECECMGNGDYQCRSLCAPPPADALYCMPVSMPGECCHRYVCDDDIDSVFPNINDVDFPEPKTTASLNNISTVLMCNPGSVLPDSVCHYFFPRAFMGNRGPKGICFGYDDIRCAWLDDNEVPGIRQPPIPKKALSAKQSIQTMFFRIDPNGTVFSTKIPIRRRDRV